MNRFCGILRMRAKPRECAVGGMSAERMLTDFLRHERITEERPGAF